MQSVLLPWDTLLWVGHKWHHFYTFSLYTLLIDFQNFFTVTVRIMRKCATITLSLKIVCRCTKLCFIKASDVYFEYFLMFLKHTDAVFSGSARFSELRSLGWVVVDLSPLPHPNFLFTQKTWICANLMSCLLEAGGSGSLKPPPTAAPGRFITLFCNDSCMCCILFLGFCWQINKFLHSTCSYKCLRKTGHISETLRDTAKVTVNQITNRK